MDSQPNDVTRLLERIRVGDDAAFDHLFPLVYDELRHLAKATFAKQRGPMTLQATALVHEAWLKLAGNMGAIDGRRHFFVVAAKAMRQVLSDHARARRAQKRGEGVRPMSLRDGAGLAPREEVDIVALDDSLNRLAQLNKRHARVVELRVLGSLTIEETAKALGVSTSTVESDWSMARAWLRRELAAS
jgi:RNA polymerase sigma factor (TIGR02999 family)